MWMVSVGDCAEVRQPQMGCGARVKVAAAMLLLLAGTGCSKNEAHREAQEAPPGTPEVVPAGSDNLVQVPRANLFPLVAARTQMITSTLDVTGSVQPDVSREVPVLSIANGRVVALHVTLGQTVHKGQLVMEVQSGDVAQAFLSYQTALANENLTNTTLTRDKLLYDKGAIAQSQLQVAQNGEDDAKAALNAAELGLHLLGVDKNHPSDRVNVYAPISGTIVAQNTTAAGAAGVNLAGTAGSFLIADLSHVWVICDVYENDLATVRLGEEADIRVNAFPGRVLTGTVSDIGAILDPSLRTAKVRIQVNNPGGLLRVGMFAAASFHGKNPHMGLSLPAVAILHLHDSDYVYQPVNGGRSFRRVTVRVGQTLPESQVEILGGLFAGDQVVSNPLQLQNAAAQ